MIRIPTLEGKCIYVAKGAVTALREQPFGTDRYVEVWLSSGQSFDTELTTEQVRELLGDKVSL